jgi:hypothetical protein
VEVEMIVEIEKAVGQRKFSPFTDSRCWNDRSLGAATAVNGFCRRRGRC